LTLDTSRIHELPPEEMAIYRRLDGERMPHHVAIIMDGNGRWAGKRGLKRFFGHKNGAEAVQYIVETSSRIGLPWLTLYAFSLENNLKRPKTEVNFLMMLLRSYLTDNVQRMNDNNVRIRYVGRTTDLPSEVCERMQWAEESTAKNTGTTLTLALNYGGRSEIVDAVRRIARDVAAGKIRPEGITEADIDRNLYTAYMPDPDLMIRTSGEMRISNFLLWQVAYTEILVTDRLWPDYRGVHLLEAIEEYQRRERRFGGLKTGTESDDVKSLPDRQLVL
jgi:undecaprenyl diphosphate synthase